MSAFAMDLACTPHPRDVQEGPQEPENIAPETALESTRQDHVAIVEVEVQAPEDLPYAVEGRALLGLLFERSLADLPGVIPMIEGTAPSPGFAQWNDPGAVRWQLTVSDRGGRQELDLASALCIDRTTCVTATATGARAQLEQSVSALTSSIARQLGRARAREAQQTHASSISKDDYAVLMTGRAAAVLYGFLKVDPAAFEDRHRDPPVRAVFLDPSIELAQWILGRVRFSREAPGAENAFLSAVALHPTDVAAQADLATTLAKLGRLEDAAAVWDKVHSLAPDDPRFRIAAIDFALLAGRPNRAEELLLKLPARYAASIKFAELRVRIAQALGRTHDEDEWLAAWQERAPADPEPVEQRTRHAIRRRAYAKAIKLSMTLEQRGRPQAALELRLVAALGIGDYLLAESAAVALEQPVLAERIRARLELETHTSTRSRVLRAARDPVTLVVRGEVRLAEGKSFGALMDAEHALATNPWWPEALSLKARAHDARGETSEAAAARVRLRLADPNYK
ncbi:MAG: hypothetical protein IPK13_04235 [Deltaproteobacteria bacterium]|nr:hypothetical protein [Deltaproteobacteria bacterium]